MYMYNKNLLKIYITLVVSITTTAASLTNATGLASNPTWPPLDVSPPLVAAWTALVDKSKYPQAPKNPVGYACQQGVDTYCSYVCYGCSRAETDITHCSDKNDWGLTYDDGPSNNTIAILDHLNQTNQKATFFVIGSRVFQNPDILQRTVREGHQIGIHTWSHPQLTTISDEQIIAELKWTELAIQKAVNLTPKLMRPPLGDCDDRVRGIATQLGYKVALWNHDTFDWKSAADPTYDLNWITGNFTEWATNKSATVGTISLEHDLYVTSASKAPAAMDIVKNNGYTARQISNCVPNCPPYVENVVLPNATSSSSSPTSGSGSGSGSGSSSPKSSAETQYIFNFITIATSFIVVVGSSMFI